MKNQNNYSRPMAVKLLISIFALVVFLTITPSAGAQSKIDLKSLKLTESAQSITFSAWELIGFFEDKRIMSSYEKFLLNGDEEGAYYAKHRGIELKEHLKKAYLSLLNLTVTLRKAGLWNEQLDKDIAKLITGSDLKTQLEKYGRCPKNFGQRVEFECRRQTQKRRGRFRRSCHLADDKD
jgi:hypothetical protein